MTTRTTGAVLILGLLGLVVRLDAQAGMQMPDAKQMSGMPLPVGDVATGTVVVRVIRGALDKPIAGQRVEIAGEVTAVATTNDTGRAEFKALQPGRRVKAIATVGTERLESQEFAVPASGGIRLMLVATDPDAEKKAAEDRRLAQSPPQRGNVVLGDQTRFVFELGDDGLTVFDILQFLNTARTPVEPPQPVVLELPEGAEGAAALEGSSPLASVAGRTVTVKGPFPPGETLVQVAYSMPYSGSTLTIARTLPVALTQLTLLSQKVGAMHLASPQMANHRDMTSEGQTYILGQGPALKAGDTLSVTFTGLPHAPTWPRNLALALATVILAAGAWGSLRRGRAAAEAEGRRRKLEAKRDKLFGELTALEEKHRHGTVDAQRYGTRRRELVTALERVYAELDEEAAA